MKLSNQISHHALIISLLYHQLILLFDRTKTEKNIRISCIICDNKKHKMPRRMLLDVNHPEKNGDFLYDYIT